MRRKRTAQTRGETRGTLQGVDCCRLFDALSADARRKRELESALLALPKIASVVLASLGGL